MIRNISLLFLCVILLISHSQVNSQERPRPRPKFDGVLPDLVLENTLLTNPRVILGEKVTFQSMYVTNEDVILASVHFVVSRIGKANYDRSIMQCNFDPEYFFSEAEMGLPSIVSGFTCHGSLHNVTTPQGIGYQRTFESLLVGVYLIQPIWLVDEGKSRLSTLLFFPKLIKMASSSNQNNVLGD
jgi:hypothetical protein